MSIKRALGRNGSARSILIAATVFTVLTSPGNLPGASTKSKVVRPAPTIAKLLRTRMTRYADALQASYARAEWKRHTALTTGMLAFLESQSIEVLIEIDQPLRNAVKAHGINPYLSVLIDYGYRLGRAPTARSKLRFRELTRLVGTAGLTPSHSKVVLLRQVAQPSRFRPYSENAGRAVSGLLFSRFGERQVAFGYRPEQFVRLAEILRSCRHIQGAPDESNFAKAQCSALAGALAGKLQGRDGSAGSVAPDSSTIADFMEGGITTAAADCLRETGDPTGSRLIREAEDWASCHEQGRGFNGDPAPVSGLGSVAAGFTGSTLDIQSVTTGMNQVGNVERTFLSDFHFGEAGLGFYESKTTRYSDPNDADHFVTVSRWAKTEPSLETGTDIIVETADGTTTTHYDSDGIATGVDYYGGGENAGTEYHAEMNSDGTIASETIVDEDGTTTVVHYSDDTKTETTYDSEGGCIKNCVNAPSTPVGETTPSACAAMTRDAIYNSRPRGNRLGPLINPDPDAPLEGALSPCLAEFISTQSSGQSGCVSVAMCLGPASMQDCSCGNSSSGRRVPPNQGVAVCAAINCGDDSCDPGTGTCTTNLGAHFPGELRPPTLRPGAKPSVAPLSGSLVIIRTSLWKGGPPALP